MKRSTWACAIALLFVGANADASPPFPSLVAQEWSLNDIPQCTLCHASLSGGTGTVVTYFGKQMQAFGLRAEDESSLAQALSRDKAEGTDSDGDGISDFDSLHAGLSPNAGPGPTKGAAPAPEYGCSVGHGGDECDPMIGLAIAIGAILRATRRRST